MLGELQLRHSDLTSVLKYPMIQHQDEQTFLRQDYLKIQNLLSLCNNLLPLMIMKILNCHINTRKEKNELWGIIQDAKESSVLNYKKTHLQY